MTLGDLLLKYRAGTVMRDGRVVESTSLGGATHRGYNQLCLTVVYTNGTREIKYG